MGSELFNHSNKECIEEIMDEKEFDTYLGDRYTEAVEDQNLLFCFKRRN